MLRKISLIVTCALAFAGGIAASDTPTGSHAEKKFALFEHESVAPAKLSPASQEKLVASTKEQDLVNTRWYKLSAINPAEFAVGDRLIILVGPNESLELEIIMIHDHSSTAGTINIAGSVPGERSFDLFLEFAPIADANPSANPSMTFSGGFLRMRQGARAFSMITVPEAPGLVHLREIVNEKPANLVYDVVDPGRDVPRPEQ